MKVLVVGAVIFLLVAVPLYFLPTVIAYSRRVEVRRWVLVANLFLGWYGPIWVACFIFSLVGEKDSDAGRWVFVPAEDSQELLSGTSGRPSNVVMFPGR